MITVNALAAADSVIIPVQAHYLPAKGMTQLMKTIHKVKRQINPVLKVDGVLLTLVDGRTNLARQTADTLRQSYPVPGDVPVLSGFTALDRAGLEGLLEAWTEAGAVGA